MDSDYITSCSLQFVQTDIEKKYCADHARAGHAHQNNFVGVGNYTDVQLYAATRNFLQENIANPIWIISPFIKNTEQDRQCSTLVDLMRDLQLGPDPNITVVYKNVMQISIPCEKTYVLCGNNQTLNIIAN